MISEKDLQDAIAECQGERHPNANTCIKLAAFLTIYAHLYPKEVQNTEIAPAPVPVTETKSDMIGDLGDSDFFRAIKGKSVADVLALMNELMDTIYVMNPRLYDGVMHQLL